MKLILQCAVCGTSHAVGTTTCPTCRATGLHDLRLLFECPKCFAVGLTPRCPGCQPPQPSPPYEVVPDPAELARLWGVGGVNGEPGGEVLVPEFVGEPVSEDHPDFELTLEDDAGHDADEELRLDEGADVSTEDT